VDVFIINSWRLKKVSWYFPFYSHRSSCSSSIWRDWGQFHSCIIILKCIVVCERIHKLRRLPEHLDLEVISDSFNELVFSNLASPTGVCITEQTKDMLQLLLLLLLVALYRSNSFFELLFGNEDSSLLLIKLRLAYFFEGIEEQIVEQAVSCLLKVTDFVAAYAWLCLVLLAELESGS